METNNSSFLNSLAAVILILLVGVTSYYYESLFKHTEITKVAEVKEEIATTTKKEPVTQVLTEANKTQVIKLVQPVTKDETKESSCLKNISVLKEKLDEKVKEGYGTYTLTPSDLVIGYNKETGSCIGGFVTTVISSSSTIESLPTMYFIVNVDEAGISPIMWSKDKNSFSLDKNEYSKTILDLSGGKIVVQ